MTQADIEATKREIAAGWRPVEAVEETPDWEAAIARLCVVFLCVIFLLWLFDSFTR